MRKNSVLFMMAVFFMALSVSAVDPEISNINVQSSWEDVVVKNETVHIRWAHSAYFTAPGQTCRIFCGDQVISPPIPVINKDFVWTGGRKFDGSYIPQGKAYRITIESPDYDALNGPEIALIDEMPKFTITAPPDGKTLMIGSHYTIRWTHSAYYDLYNTAKLLLVVNTSADEPYIADVPVINNQYVWKVGKMRDGSSIAPGNYELSAEANEYWHCNDVGIKLIPGIIGPVFRVHVEKIWINKLPDCPMCFKLDPAQFKFDPEGLRVFEVELLRNGVVLARLGRFGPRLAVPGPVKFTMEPEPLRMKMRQKANFKLRFLSIEGKILLEQAVEVEIAK